MPKRIRISDEFIQGLAQIYSGRLLDRIRNLLSLLPDNPEIGSRNVRQSLIDQFGDGIRKLPVSTFVIVYRVSEEYVDVLALVYGPSIR